MRRPLCIALVCAGLAACDPAGSDPCPIGFVADRATDRCVAVDAGAPATCSAADLDAWAATHHGSIVGTIGACTLSCDEAPACVTACLVSAAGLEACDDCVRAQLDCSAFACRSACMRATDADCRACLCEAGCVSAFEACARASLPVCDGVHGRAATAADLDLDVPIVLRRKSGTGFTQVRSFVADDPTADAWRLGHAAAGWTHFVAFTIAGVDYVLEVMGRCGRTRCPYRISPVLRDGARGYPVEEGQWSVGWDVFTTFTLDGELYLLQHKSGSISTEGEPRGAVRVHHVRPDTQAPGLALELVVEGTWARPMGLGWSHVRSFALGGRTFLLRYQRDAASAHAEILRVQRAGGELQFVHASRELGWGAGWQIVETFPIGSRWYLLQYADGRALFSAVRTEDDGALVATPPLLSARWPDGLTRIVPLRTSAATYFLRQNFDSGEVDYVRLPSDVTTWRADTFEVLHSEDWFLAWDVVAVARARLWEDP